MPALSRRKNIPKWRYATLIAVHVLAGLHILHWSWKGRSLAPLELSETLHTVHTGLINAGFILMCLVLLGTFVFGRFFCGWGCHILALQDLSAGILKKLHIKPKPVKSRLLLWAPFLAFGYMFVWPQVARLWNGVPFPKWKVLPGTEAWGSFVTHDFWRQMPGWAMASFTFLVCGFALVYILGSRSFCNYACPYGAIFKAVDKLSLGKIAHLGGCNQCGLCTANCSTGIPVAAEIKAFNQVVSTSCLKCMDCVAGCPNGALGFRFKKPAFFGRLKRVIGFKYAYTLTRGEEAVAAASFLAFLAVYNGLYESFPLLLSLAVAGILAYGAVLLRRTLAGRPATLGRAGLTAGGRPTAAGWMFAAGFAAVLAFTAHSAYVHFHAYVGRHYYHRLMKPAASPEAARTEALALHHLQRAYRAGLWHSPAMDQHLGSLFLRRGRVDLAEKFLANLLDKTPRNFEARIRLANVYGRQGRREEEKALWAEGLELHSRKHNPDDARAAAFIRTRLGAIR